MTGRAQRVVGVDVARCVALVGMMATHILPGVVDGRVPIAQHAAGGRAAALFAVLAGVSLVLVGGRDPLRGRDWQGMVAGTAVRAVLIGLVGLLLGEVDSGIAVILVYYALFFLAAVPFLALPTWAVALAAGAWALIGPQLSWLVRQRLPPTSYEVPSFASLADPVALVRDLAVTGYYPALTWVPYLLVGVVVGRLALRGTRATVVLVLLGTAAVALSVAVSAAALDDPQVRGALVRSFEGAGWRGDLETTLTHGLYGTVPTGSAWWLLVRAPHSGTTPDLLMTTGSALLVLGACLVIGRAAPRVCGVVFGAGAMTLTLYSLHVTFRGEGFWDGDDLVTFLGQVAVVLLIGVQFRLARLRGPLEELVGAPSNAVRRWRAGDPARRSGSTTVAP